MSADLIERAKYEIDLAEACRGTDRSDWSRSERMLEELAAEIVRLRGEVKKLAAAVPLPRDPTAHRWNDDGEKCLVCGDKDWMGGPCSGAIAPAEAKGDAPWRAAGACMDAKALATAQEIAHMWGQDRSQFVSRIQVAVLDAMAWMGAAQAVTPQPADGGAVAVYQIRHTSHFSEWREVDASDYEMAGGLNGCERRTLYTHPPAAQVQQFPEYLKDPATVHALMLRGVIATPSWRSMVDLRGEVPNGEDVQLARIAQLQEQLATHPAAGDKVRELLGKLRERVAAAYANDPGSVAGDLMEWVADELEAALAQPQEAGRGA